MAGLDTTDKLRVRKDCGCHNMETQRNWAGNQGHLEYVYRIGEERGESSPGEG